MTSSSAQNVFHQAVSAHRQNRLSQATQLYQQCLKLDPYLIPAYNNLAVCQASLGQPSQALRTIKQALTHAPNYAPAYSTQADILRDLGKLQLSIDSYHTAIHLDPNFIQAHLNLANLYTQMHELKLANHHYHQVLLQKPHHQLALLNLGKNYRALGDYPHSIQTLQFLLSLLPRHHDAQYQLSLTYEQTRNLSATLNLLETAHRQNPHHYAIAAKLLNTYFVVCTWEPIPKLKALVLSQNQQLLQQHQPPRLSPGFHLYLSYDLAQNQQIAQAWCQTTQKQAQALNLPPAPKSTRSRPRLGFISRNFFDHATSHLFSQPLQALNQLFQVHLYSYNPKGHDAYVQFYQDNFDNFFDILATSTPQLHQLIQSHQVDIFTDLKGQTDQSRLTILATRPAPIIVHYLGYPGTTGADFIDYFITDSIASPPQHKTYFTEKLMYLPHTYQANSHQPISPTFNHPLPKPNEFIFTNMNKPYKFQPPVFRLWLKLLKNTPHSKLILYEPKSIVQKNLLQFAQKHHLPSSQLIFVSKLPKPDHLARIQKSHLALDTIMVNGHTTTSDALLAGVPVVTVLGKHFASRVSASLLLALGLSECITHSLDDYYHLALSLAQSPHKLSRLKRKLIYAQTRYPLFDTKRFVKNLESAYTTMWSIYQAGEKPRSFHITDPLPLDNSYIK